MVSPWQDLTQAQIALSGIEGMGEEKSKAKSTGRAERLRSSGGTCLAYSRWIYRRGLLSGTPKWGAGVALGLPKAASEVYDRAVVEEGQAV